MSENDRDRSGAASASKDIRGYTGYVRVNRATGGISPVSDERVGRRNMSSQDLPTVQSESEADEGESGKVGRRRFSIRDLPVVGRSIADWAESFRK